MKKALKAQGLALLLFSGAALADDTDIYLTGNVAVSGQPLVMFSLDYRPNLASTVCNGTECDSLVADGYLSSTPTTFFELLQAVLKKVFEPLKGVKVGLMLNHDDSCSGGTTAGPSLRGCSNGGYILRGFESLDEYDSNGAKADFHDALAAIPLPLGALSHSWQGKELYFELFRYLTGQGVYNGHLGYRDFGNKDSGTNLDDFLEDASWDTDIETNSGRDYLSPLAGVAACSKIYVINLMFQVANQEDDSDKAIVATKANGGMGGINPKNGFDTVVRYLYEADLADGSFNSAVNLSGKQHVTSFFIVNPNQINTTTNGYAQAGGTGFALPLSENPEELIATLNSIFRNILSVSTTFVSASVPVNVFNRTQVLDEIYIALFEAESNGRPQWVGDVKKLRMTKDGLGNTFLGDALGANAIATNGRIAQSALTYWTKDSLLPPPDPAKQEVAFRDGRSVARGGAGQLIPGYLSGSPGLSNTDTGARQIWTEPSAYANGTAANMLAFDATTTMADTLWTDLTAKWPIPASSGSYAAATAAEQTEALDLIRFARGIDVTDEDGDGSRTDVRPWLFADALHSRPEPINYGARGSYTNANPDIRLVVATNDGMVRMIRNTLPGTPAVESGEEVWAFIPRAALPVLKRLKDNAAGIPIHPYGVDGPPAVYIDDQNGNGTIESGDKVYVFIGERRGGKNYFGLDISDPDDPKMLWSIGKGAPGTAFAEFGQTWGEARVGKLDITNDATRNPVPVLVFGGGYNGDDDGDALGDLGKDVSAAGSNDDEGNALFIINALDGSLIWKAVKGTGGSTASVFQHADLNDSVPTTITVLDTIGDGVFDRAYFGDTGGVVWRADISGPDTSQWTLTKLFSVGRHYSANANADRRFFHRPDVVKARDSQGAFDAVIIGSGDRAHPLETTIENWVYMYKDRGINSGTPPTVSRTHADFEDISDNCLQDLDVNCTTTPDLSIGWRMRLALGPGEKSLATPLTVTGTVFFTTYFPAASGVSNSCAPAEGSGALYAVSLQDGTATRNYTILNDLDGGGELQKEDRVTILKSSGIPAEVIAIPPDKILRPDLTTEDINTRGAWRTFWYTVDG
jgi:type IV pilus assembly protein PilY1